MITLAAYGWAQLSSRLSSSMLEALRTSAFAEKSPGQRCLLDNEAVRESSTILKGQLIETGVLPASAVAIQAIAFDKNPSANWKVTWHQDLMFPLANTPKSAGYNLPSVKEGVSYARPPRHVLEALLAVRVHLDDCDATNGPLRVAPGSHIHGILKSTEITGLIQRFPGMECLARTGEALLMKPLLLHASSPATAPKHRRVLHYVYHTGLPVPEPWYRQI